MSELERQEEKLIYMQLAPTKTIKCTFCDHKGQSEVDEETSIITYLIFVMMLVGTYDWAIAQSFLWYMFLFLIVLPLIGGILRIQTHSCPQCLNEVQ